MSPHSKIRILVADDHHVVRGMLCEFLADHGFETIEAANGLDAMHKIVSRPDLIVMDLQMPLLNGARATYEIKKIAPHIKIIGISISDPMNAQRMTKAGVEAFVPKDMIFEELIPAISCVLDSN